MVAPLPPNIARHAFSQAPPLVALDKILLLVVRCAVLKRLLLCSGLFLAGVLVGLGIAWLAGSLRSPATIRPITAGARSAITVTLSATIDGSDRFIFTHDTVWNEHGRWQPPQKVLFNGEPWEDLSQAPPGWPELARDLDLRRAGLLTREGRDMVALEVTAEGFDLLFADTQMGAATYSATISIPRK
jgi:hypothetical protein